MRIPAVLAALLAAIAVSFAGSLLLSQAAMGRLLFEYAVIPARFSAGPEGYDSLLDAIKPLIGHMFLHGGIMHVLFNGLITLQMGAPVARVLNWRPGGSLRFVALFLGAGIAGGLTYVALNPGSLVPAIGASGAACGIVAAYLIVEAGGWRRAAVNPRALNAAFWFLVVNVGLAYVARVSNIFPIAWEAHLGGFLAGAVLTAFLGPREIDLLQAEMNSTP